jgi:hypothetical protein
MESERPEPDELSQQAVTALVAQYRECSAHHLLSNTLIWQLPAVAITVSGILIAATFGYDVPDVARAVVTAAGSFFVFALTIAVERYRMLQIRRRKDMAAIERELAPLGVRPIAWAAGQVAEEIQTGAFEAPGLYLYRLDGFNVLRALLYATTVLLVALSVVALADSLGAEILS